MPRLFPNEISNKSIFKIEESTCSMRLLNFILSLMILVVFSCEQQPKKEAKEVSEEAVPVLSPEVKEMLNTAINEMPSPVEIIAHVQESGSDYQPALLNDPANYSRYLTTNFDKAVNLGIYVTDLGYASLYFKSQDAIEYLKPSKSISEELGIIEAFEGSLINRFEDNLGNRDSLLNLLRESFYYTDEYLDENNRSEIAAMLIAGGWLEGLFISASAVSDHEAEEAMQPIIWRIGQQKLSLETLLHVLELIPDNFELSSFRKSLLELKGIFNEVEIEEVSEDNIIDIAELNDLGELVAITAQEDLTRVKIQLSTFEDIREKVIDIRNQLIE